MSDEERLRTVLAGGVDAPAVHRPYTGRSDTFVTYYPLSDEVMVYASDKSLRYATRWRVTISSRVDYTAIKGALYLACLEAGMKIADSGPESESETNTGYRTWPFDVVFAEMIRADK